MSTNGIKFTVYKGLGCIECRLTQNCYNACSHQGQCDSDVEYWVSKLSNKLKKLPADMIRKCLKSTGGWDNEELENHERNLERFLWITAGQCKEQKSCTTYVECY